MTLQILLVDDNLTFLASVKKSLKLVPNTSVLAEAHDGVQALALAQQLQPDLVLLDIVMPGLSGLEVAKAMQAWPRAPQVLFLSMHDNESYRLAAESLGSLGLVSKSNFVNELLPILAGLAASPKGGTS
ncbi:response regulator transcription factor [Rhodoferax sp. BLA1]|uniref:response regulator n=1 Tax=Rhodoferax sp. BLA1 TaxID=2576062 RepID=UPI0015D3FBBF|nr:response regulator transcription factor [Rhodoferax sp. BLA1]